jgi:peptidoglycan/LPS O-acetylase OafA/YrhL
LQFKLLTLRISRFSNKTDLSYGIYLYARPAQTLIIWNYRAVDPWLLSVFTLVSTACLAHVSWNLVEKPGLALRDAGGRNLRLKPERV